MSSGVAVERGAIHQAVLMRRSVRVFQSRMVPPEVVEGLLQAACWAPSPHNVQPWRFTVLSRDEDKRRLADSMADRLATELREDGLAEDAIARQTHRSRERIVSAPVVILCSLTADGLVTFPDRRRTELEWQMAVQSVGAVLQTLFLLAWERGLGSCWMAAPMYCPDVVRTALDLPERYVPQALVLVGYSDGAGKVRPRRPLEEIVELR
jgi:coenzyme F420-0:L-glutamate ligase/coenzyme F420-1:gamma-L-glutamate ligase